MRCYAKICQGTRTIQIPEYNNLGEVLNIVVATTRQNGTHSLLTSAKLLVGYLVVGIYKRT